eukprot:412906_1
MAPSFVFVIYLLFYAANSMGWYDIWYDDCDSNSQGDWVCKRNDCKLPVDESGRCQHNNCYELCWGGKIERSTTISDYAGYHLRLSLYVHLQEGALSSDRCRIWFAYDNEDYDIDNYDWQCGSPCDGTQTIDIPSSTGHDTLGIALGIYDEDHTHCCFDSLELQYQLP